MNNILEIYDDEANVFEQDTQTNNNKRKILDFNVNFPETFSELNHSSTYKVIPKEKMNEPPLTLDLSYDFFTHNEKNELNFIKKSQKKNNEKKKVTQNKIENFNFFKNTKINFLNLISKIRISRKFTKNLKNAANINKSNYYNDVLEILNDLSFDYIKLKKLNFLNRIELKLKNKFERLLNYKINNFIYICFTKIIFITKNIIIFIFGKLQIFDPNELLTNV